MIDFTVLKLLKIKINNSLYIIVYCVVFKHFLNLILDIYKAKLNKIVRVLFSLFYFILFARKFVYGH